MRTRVKETVQSVTAQKMIIWVFFIAAGVLVPMGFHRLGLGIAFLPMHIPVFIGAFLCGPYLGMAGAVLTVLLSSVLTGMPPIFPVGICMMAEMAAYAGVCAGIMRKKRYSILSLYAALVAAIAAGRVINGIVNAVVAALLGGSYGMSAFVEGTLVYTLPGTVLLLCVVPGLVMILENILRFNKRGEKE